VGKGSRRAVRVVHREGKGDILEGGGGGFSVGAGAGKWLLGRIKEPCQLSGSGLREDCGTRGKGLR
jgi:hypothetical protein